MDIRRATKIVVNFFYVVEFQYEDALTIKVQLEKCLRAWRGSVTLQYIYIYIYIYIYEVQEQQAGRVEEQLQKSRVMIRVE